VVNKPAVAADRAVPALILKAGRYPLHSGGLAAIRTLGRLGVPVYAITEDRFTPAALSRYCSGRFGSPVSTVAGSQDPRQAVTALRAIGRRIGARCVLVPVDDESAVLIAEHAGDLAEHFLFPGIAPGLPRQLANKAALFALCRQFGVPAPHTVAPSTVAELTAYAAAGTFPVIAKNAEAWVARHAALVPGTTVLRTPAELLALVRPGGAALNLILQEYLPPEHAQDWITHLYCDASGEAVVLGTGIKVRSWPPHAGVTACARVADNPVLALLARRFCRDVGFRGVADLDWRLDLRDGQYKLVDFNPRMGNQFRLFETRAGADVVRALHLDLTGRVIPAGGQIVGRRIIVEHVDLPARLAYRRSDAPLPAAASRAGPRHRAGTELAWLSAADPVPFLAMWLRFARPAAASIARVSRLPGGWRLPAAQSRLAGSRPRRRAGRPPADGKSVNIVRTER